MPSANQTPAPRIPTRALDGARVLVRHWQTTKPAEERWLKEFSADGLRVRLTKKADDKRERGTWYVCRELRIEAVLDAANAPDESPEDDR